MSSIREKAAQIDWSEVIKNSAVLAECIIIFGLTLPVFTDVLIKIIGQIPLDKENMTPEAIAFAVFWFAIQGSLAGFSYMEIHPIKKENLALLRSSTNS